MLPVFTIVGRPNVGKSTLFNVLTKTRNALVADMPGVTRDRQYGDGVLGDRPYIVVDTGGLGLLDDPDLASMTDQQVQEAIDEADVLLFIVDAQTGLTPADEAIAKQLRPQKDKVIVLVNKSDREQAEVVTGDFYKLGFAEPIAISATMKRNVESTIEQCLQQFPEDESSADKKDKGIHIAVVGRPNVGKSTLINRILGEERVVVLDRPGTTRDSVFVPFERRGQQYTLIDTAGVRRKSKVDDRLEKFSIVKTLQAIEASHVVILVINAREGITEQDAKLIGLVLQAGKALVIAVNKWDGMSDYDHDRVKEQLDRRLAFADFARRYFISALHGTGVGKLYFALDEAYAAASQTLSTSQLTRVLEKAIADHQPPLVGGRRIKPRYAHMGGHHPMIIIVHGKQVAKLPGSYKRYIANVYRKAFNLMSVPLILRFKNDDNPYV